MSASEAAAAGDGALFTRGDAVEAAWGSSIQCSSTTGLPALIGATAGVPNWLMR